MTREEQHPVVVQQRRRRAKDVQLRVADTITKFAGSMLFVYAHVAIFVLWMIVAEKSPWPTLTLVVSLEAIFLSTFVMIGQNRQADFQQAKADHDFREQETMLAENTRLTRSIHTLTTQLRKAQLSQQKAEVPSDTSRRRTSSTPRPRRGGKSAGKGDTSG